MNHLENNCDVKFYAKLPCILFVVDQFVAVCAHSAVVQLEQPRALNTPACHIR